MAIFGGMQEHRALQGREEEMQHNRGRANTMRGKGLNAVIGMSTFKYWTEGEPVCEILFPGASH